MARLMTPGALGAVGTDGKAFRPQSGSFNISVYGTFVATLVIERSFDGATWLNCSKSDFTDNSFSIPISLVLTEPADGYTYRLRCTAWTSGTANYRFEQ